MNIANRKCCFIINKGVQRKRILSFAPSSATRTLFLFYLLLLTQVGTAFAVPGGVSFNNAVPLQSGALLVARTAANNPQDTPTFQLKFDIVFNNTSSNDETITQTIISYPGSTITAKDYVPVTFSDDEQLFYTIPSGNNATVFVYDGLTRDLPTPLPPMVQIEVFFGLDPDPLVLNYTLAFHENDVIGGAYYFPGKTKDLSTGQYWQFSTRHVIDSGGGTDRQINPTSGSQRYALDASLVQWHSGGWQTVIEGTDGSQNNNIYMWGLPIYAMEDGVIVSCYRGEADHLPMSLDQVDGPPTIYENLFGNSVVVRHGDELVALAHFRQGSIPPALCPNTGQNDNLNIPVSAGQFLGRVGNTGRSSAPHLHWQVNDTPIVGGSTIGGAPMLFLNVRALSDEDSVNNLGDTPDLKSLHFATLHRHTLLLPNPCRILGPLAGAREIVRREIPADCLQDQFNRSVKRGYRPVYVDGYDIAGETFFNMIYRSKGGNWSMRHAMTASQYQDFYNEMKVAGLKLLHIDSYLENGSVRYAAIFRVRPGPNPVGFHGLTDTEYDNDIVPLLEKGYIPINISAVEITGLTYWSGLLELVPVGWHAETPSADDFQATSDSVVKQGFVPWYVQGFDYIGLPFITGIWMNPLTGNWAAAHNRDTLNFKTESNNNALAGRLTRSVTGYDNGSGVAFFAGIWHGQLDTIITSTPSVNTGFPFANFYFHSDTPFASFQCKLNSGLAEPCTSPHSYTNLVEGEYLFTVTAIDRDGYKDPTPAQFTWTVDFTPPTAELLYPPAGSSVILGRVKGTRGDNTLVVGWSDFVISASDTGGEIDKVQFFINSVAAPDDSIQYDPTTANWTLTFLPTRWGRHLYHIEIITTDTAGNESKIATSVEAIRLPTSVRRKVQ